MKKTFFFFVVLCLLSGCATICHRFSKNSPDDFAGYPNCTYMCSRIYPAARMTHASLEQCFSVYNGENCGSFHYLSWRVTPFHLIDLPISLVVDTICLPYDFCRNRDYRSNARGWYRYRRVSRYVDYCLGAEIK